MAIDPDAADNKRRAISALITKLWGHYWVPDMPRALSAELMIDWVHDLEDYDLAAIDAGCTWWRRSPKGVFPKPGQLIEIIVAEQRLLRARADHLAVADAAHHDFRPQMWWALPLALWKPHWRFEEIPHEWQETTQTNQTKRDAGP